MFLELFEVFVLLLKLLLELKELLLLPHSDGIVLVGFLALCECISVQRKAISTSPGSWRATATHPDAWPPTRGAPVSPPAMARVVVEKAAPDRGVERSAGRTA